MKDVLQHLSKDQPNDMTVSWTVNGESFTCRWVSLWDPQSRRFVQRVSNLPVARYDAFAVGQIYKLRWQIELLFKEWKSHANRRAFSTANASIVEGLLWAAIGVATVKRPLAHSVQIAAEVATSTLRTAKCAGQIIPGLGETLLAKAPQR